MKPTGKPLSLRKFCVLLFMLVSYTDTYVVAAPKGGHVVSGTATFQQNGNLTVITAGNKSIINYGSFNIAPGETVQFVQPSAQSSVLNRVVGSANPTQIFGMLEGNGRVFIVNPYGIYFCNGSVINVGSLYAGAGNLSDADFARGKVHFTDLAGDVRNDGVVAADNRIALMGANVVNTGSLNAAKGMAMMVSGKDVYVGEKDGNIFVQANGKSQAGTSAAGGATAAKGSSGSIINSGTVAAPRVLIGGGDLYSTAISNSGLLQGHSVTVNAGRAGTATVGGKIAATSGAPGATADAKGGSIQVLGGTVALKGATLDASGTAGGGSVRVGGDFHGQGNLAHAATTIVDAATTIKADATGATGNGGTVVLWSDGLTSYQGQISANAGGQGGDGGQVEVSSHGQLGFTGGVNANAPAGKVGSLLLDPTNIDITPTTGAGVGTVPANGTVAATDATPTTISASSLEALGAGINIDLEATKDIRIEDLGLRLDTPANSGFLNLAPATATTSGTVTFRAGVGGTGSFVMAGSTARTIAGLVATAPPDTILAPGRNVTISASGPSAGGINSTGGNASANAIEIGSINTSSAVRGGGSVTLQLTGTTAIVPGPIQVYSLNTSSTAGAGGAVAVGGTGTTATLTTSAAPTAITLGSATANAINTAGSTTPGTINLTTTPAGTINFAAAPTFTGDTSLTAGSLTIGGGGTMLDGGTHNLSLTLGVVVSLASIVNNSVANFASLGTGGVAIDRNNFITTGSQVYDSPGSTSPITLSHDATLAAGNAGGVGVTLNGPLYSSTTTMGMTTTTDAHTLTINTGGVTQINAAVGGSPAPGVSAALGGFATDYQAGANDATILNVPGGAAAVTTVNNGTATGAQTYGDAVLLTTNSTLASTVSGMATAGGTITFQRGGGTLTTTTPPPAFSLGITNNGTTTFNAPVGTGIATSPLSSLTTGTGTTNLNTSDVITSDTAGQTYNGPVVLGGTGTTTLTAGPGPVSLTGAVTGTTAGIQALAISTRNTTTLGGAVGTVAVPLASLSTGMGAVLLNGSAVNTSGAGGQAYNGPVTLGPATNATILAAGNWPINFISTVEGNTPLTQALTLTTSGAQTFTGTVGAANALASLVTGTGTTTLRGNTVRTNGLQTYNGPVILGQPGGAAQTTTLTSLNAGDITFIRTVDSNTAGAQALVVNTAGKTTFGGFVGTTPLASVTTDLPATAATSLNGGVTTTGTQTYADGVSLAGNTTLTTTLPPVVPNTTTVITPAFAGNGFDLTLTLSSNVLANFYTGVKNFTSNGTSPASTTTIAGNFSTTGSQTYGNPVTLTLAALPTVLTAGTGAGNPSDITFNSTLDGAVALTLNTPGNEVFNGLVGGGVPLLSLTTDAVGPATGQAQFKMNAGSANALNPAGVNIAGALKINDGALFQATGVAAAHPTVQTLDAQTYNGAATVSTGTLLKNNGIGALGAITFGSTVVGGGDLTLATAGTTTFNGLVGAGAGNALGSLTINAGGAGTALNTTGITTTGTQTYNSPLTLGANVALTTTNPDPAAGAVTFGSTLGGAGFNLTTATQGGNTVFGLGSGAAAAPINNLTTSVNGSTIFNNAAFTTAGTQTYQGPVVVQSAAAGTGATGLTLTSTGGSIAFNKTLVSAGAPASNLTVTTGNAAGEAVTFGGAVGGGLAPLNASALNTLTVTSPTIHIDGGSVNTLGAQNYTGGVLLGTDTTFVGSTVTVNGTGNVVNAQTHDLTLTLSSLVTIPLGNRFTNIHNFTSNGAGGTAIATNSPAAFTTTGYQHYDNPTTLTANSTLNAGPGGFEFGSNPGGTPFTLSSPGTAFALTLHTTGPVAFNGGVGGGGAPLAALTITTGAGMISLNGGAITTTGGQSYGGAVVLGAPGGPTTLTSTSGGEIDFLFAVNGLTPNTRQLTTSTSNAVVYSGPVGNLAALNQLNALGTGTTKINGGSVTTFAGGQFYQGPVTVGAANTVLQDTATGGLGALNFVSTLDNTASGTPTLTLSTGGTTTFGGAVGSGAVAGSGPLGNLLVTGGGVIKLNGGSVRSTGFQEYNGSVTLGAASTLLSSTGSNVTFDKTLDGTTDGGQALVVNAAGDEVFTGLVGSATTGRLASLTTDNAGVTTGTTRFNMTIGTAAAGVNVANDVTINDAVAFGAMGSSPGQPTVLTGGSQTYAKGGSASQNTALRGGGTLTSGGTLDFNQHDLSVHFGGQITVPGAFANVANFSSDGAGGTLLNGAFTTTGAQAYGNLVTLANNPSLNAVGAVTFASRVDGATLLAIGVTGPDAQVVFNDLVGNDTALTGLNVSTSGTTATSGTHFNMGAGASTVGKGGVNVGTTGLTVTGPAFFNEANSTLTTADHPSVVSVGVQTYNGAVTLQLNTGLLATGATSAITFGGTVDGPVSLAASTPGNEVFNGPVGGTTALGGFATDPLFPGVAPTPTDEAQFGALAAVRVNGAVTLNDEARFAVAGSTLTNPTVLTFGNGPQTYANPVLLGSQTVFTSTAGAPTDPAYTANGQITFGSTVSSASGRQNLYVRTVVGQTQLPGGVDATSFDLGGALATFTGQVGPVGIFSVEPNSGTGGSVAVGGTFTTTGPQQYNTAVILTAPTVLAAGGNITFLSTVDSDAPATPRALTLNTGGLTVFDGPVGGTTPLLSLTTDAGGTTQINGGLIRTTGAQTYGDAVLLGANTTLASTASGDIAFASTVDSVAILPDLGDFSLAINTGGQTRFSGVVGGTGRLSTLTTDGPGTTLLAGGAVNTVAGQTYNDPVTLGADTILNDGLGSLDLHSTVTGPFALTLNFGGSANLGGAVSVASLQINGNGLLISGGSVTTTGSQNYDGIVFLKADTTLTSTGGGGIHFGASLLGTPYHLTISTGGAVGFDSSVYAESLTVGGGGFLTISGGLVQTVDGQTYKDAVQLGADTLLTSTNAGNLTFNDPLNGAHALTLDTAGLTTFNQSVGNSAALTSLTTTAAGVTRLNGGLVATTGAQFYGNAVQLGSDNVLSSSAGGDLTFNSTLNGAQLLTLNTGGNTVFNAGVGVLTPLAGLTTDAPGATLLNARQVFVSGAQFYGDVVTLGHDTTLSGVSAGTITFHLTLDGAFALNLLASSVREFDGAVGGTTPLASLGTDGSGVTRINGGQVNTVGFQAYRSPVTLGADAVAASTGGDIRFARALDSDAPATPRNLTVNTTGTTEFDGAVGGGAALGSLTTDAGGTTLLAGGTITTVRTALTSGNQTYNDAVQLGASTALNSTGGGNLTFNRTVDGAFALTLDTGGLTVFNGVVGSGTPLTGLTSTLTGSPGEETQFNITVGGARAGVTVNGAVTINDDVRFDILGASLAQPGVLTVAQIGTLPPVNADQAYTNNVRLAANTFLTSADTLPAPGGAFTGGGAISFNIAPGTSLTSVGGSDLSVRSGVGTTRFASTINVGSLDLGGANATFAGPVTLPGLLSVAPNDNSTAGFVELAGGGLTTAGAQTYRVGLLLGAPTVLTSTGGGDLTFNGTVDSDPAGPARALNLNTSGNEYFYGLVGHVGPLASLTTDNPGPVGGTAYFRMPVGGAVAGVNVVGDVTINDAVSFEATGSSLAQPTILTGGSQTYNGAATLGQDTALVGGLAGSLVFNSTLDGPSNLTLRTGALQVFNGLVGSTTALANLTTNGGGTQFNQVLTGTAAPAGVRVTGDLTATGPVFFNVVGASAAQPSVLTGGAQTYRSAATLAQTTVLAGGGGLTFRATLDGAFALTLNTGGTTEFDGIVGGGTPLASLTTDAPGSTVLNTTAITTTGAQDYGDGVTLQSGITLTSNAAGLLIFRSTLDGAFALTLATAGTTQFNGAVGNGVPLASLTTDAPGTTVLNAGGVTTTGAQTFRDAVTLARDTTLASTATGDLTFNSALDGAFALTLNTAAATRLNGAVGNGVPLASLTTDAAGTTILKAGTITTTGKQDFGDGVTLQSGTTLTSNAAGLLIFRATLDGTFALTLNTAGTTEFDGTIGTGGALASLVTDAPGTTLLNGGSITTTGVQTFNDGVTLAKATTLAANGQITFANSLNGSALPLTITGATAASFNTITNTGALDWTVNGPTALDGTVGAATGAAGVASLSIRGNGVVTVNTDSIHTAGDQLFTGQVILNTARGTTENFRSDGGTVDFESPVTANGHDLNVTAQTAKFGPVDRAGFLNITANRTVFGNTVGAVRLAVSGALALNGSSVTTRDNQEYGGEITLGKPATLTSTLGNVLARSAVTGNANALTVNAVNATFLDRITGTGATRFTVSNTATLDGEVTNAASLTVDGTGKKIVLNTDRVQTNDFQTYSLPVSLGDGTSRQSNGDIILVSGNGGLTFNSTLDAGTAQTRNVTLSSPGSTVFNGRVGYASALASLTLGDAPGDTTPEGGSSHQAFINGGLVQTVNSQVYNGLVTTNADNAGGTTTLKSNGGDLIFNRTVTGAAGNLTATGNRIRLAEDANVLSGDLNLAASGELLLLEGSNYTSSGTVVFNGDPNTNAPDRLRYSTIVLTSNSVLVKGDSFQMGDLQKLYAPGALTIDVGRGVATVGDLAAGRTLRINADTIFLLNRPGGAMNTLGVDGGLTFAAGQSINFGGANLQFADRSAPQTASFVTTTGSTTIARRLGLSVFRNPNLAAQFRGTGALASTGLFDFAIPQQPIGGGSQTLDTAAAISGALPDQKPLDIPVDVNISASQMEELRKLGINPRKAEKREYGASSKRALFAQLVDSKDTENYGRLQPIKGGVSQLVPSEYVVVVDRMSEREVQTILKAFEDLYGKDKAKAPVIGTAYQKAYDDYTVEKKTDQPDGFAPYLKEKAGQYPDVDNAARGFDNLFGYIEHMGLTPVEVTKAEGHIVSDLGMSNPSSDDMVKVINAQRKALPPAQKAPSSKLPPAPPMASPGPATSPAPAASPAAKKEAPLKMVDQDGPPAGPRTAECSLPGPPNNPPTSLAGL